MPPAETSDHPPTDRHPITDGAPSPDRDRLVLHDRSAPQLAIAELYALLRLRVDVFVVEQACPYPELDGRDLDPGTRHLWLADAEGSPVACLRLLAEAGATRIGRVATRADRRGRGLAGRLLDHALASSPAPHVLDAQSHLRAWYEGRGFAVAGPEFVEDGIPHLPMRRPAP